MGWSFECVRKWWRRFRDGGYDALRSVKRSASGPMARSHPRVHYVALRLKLEHPKWGPEVIDARTLVPMDYDLILQSVRKTGRLVIVQEACRRGGVGGEIAAFVNEHAFDALDAPIDEEPRDVEPR